MIDLSTHVLDTATGKPAIGVEVQLQQLQGDDWSPLATVITNEDGRAPELAKVDNLAPGIYRLRFDIADYLKSSNATSFYPWVEIIVELEQGHYHVPLLLSPYGYTTYRGS